MLEPVEETYTGVGDVESEGFQEPGRQLDGSGWSCASVTTNYLKQQVYEIPQTEINYSFLLELVDEYTPGDSRCCCMKG